MDEHDYKKILIIDDQPENAQLLQDRLERSGFSADTAFDGPSGIQKAEEFMPDLILLDVMMPGMSGFEVCEKLVDSKKTRNIPIILVTALTSPEDIKQGLQLGAFDYIKKPFNKVELIARINSALRFSETRKVLLEVEKINTYAATIVTANHEIKQPLTLINLSTAAIRRQLNYDEIKKDAILKRVGIIEDASKNIMRILEKLTAIKNPEFTEYLNNMKMILLSSQDLTNTNNNSDNQTLDQ